MHRFIILADEIVTLDTAAERATARRWMADAGIAQAAIMEGGPDGEQRATGEAFLAEPASPAFRVTAGLRVTR